MVIGSLVLTEVLTAINCKLLSTPLSGEKDALVSNLITTTVLSPIPADSAYFLVGCSLYAKTGGSYFPFFNLPVAIICSAGSGSSE